MTEFRGLAFWREHETDEKRAADPKMPKHTYGHDSKAFRAPSLPVSLMHIHSAEELENSTSSIQ